MVRVQHEDFDPGREVERLRAGRCDIGAVVQFLGAVRDFNDGAPVSALTLEHYPGMAEEALERIAAEARERWAEVRDILIIHRVGALAPGDRIVLVAVAAAHRGPAFRACEYVVDALKSRVPFWKREQTPAGPRWAAAPRQSDRLAGEEDEAKALR